MLKFAETSCVFCAHRACLPCVGVRAGYPVCPYPGQLRVRVPGSCCWHSPREGSVAAGRSQQPGSSLLALRLPSAHHTVGRRRGLHFPLTPSCRLAKDSHNWRKRLSTLILALPKLSGASFSLPGISWNGTGGRVALCPTGWAVSHISTMFCLCRHKCFHFHLDLFLTLRGFLIYKKK